MKPKAGFGGYLETAAHFAAESSTGNNQSMGDVEHAKIHDFYVPPRFLRLFDGPSTTISDLWRVLERPVVDGGFIVGTIIKPKLGLRPLPFASACYDVWQGGDFILETFGENADHVAFLVDGYVTSPAAITTARRAFSKQYIHYHWAGHGAVTSPSAMRGYTAFVLSKMARMQGASGIHTGTMGFGKMEGEAADKLMAYMIMDDSADGPYYHQEWHGMGATTPIMSGGMNALRMPGFFANLGHSNLILTAGGGAFGHIDGAAEGAVSLRQAEQCWKQGADPLEFAQEHRQFARAFESFPGDADALFPDWRRTLRINSAA